MPWGSSPCVPSPHPRQSRADMSGKECLLWVQKSLFTSGLLGVTGIPESSWGMGGAGGKRLLLRMILLLKRASPSLPSHSCPPSPNSWSLASVPRGLWGEQLVSEGLIRAQSPWLRAGMREQGSEEDRLAATSLVPSS